MSDKSKIELIELSTFIQATRDSGYRGTTCAVAELVDNAIEANAKSVSINIATDPLDPESLTVSVQDNGSGMSRETLQRSLQFGWSSRFGNRHGMGRYGMGLPNSSVSQCRKVAVYSWQSPSQVYFVALDIDDVISRRQRAFTPALPVKLPSNMTEDKSGTLVVWSRCDRVDYRRIGPLCSRLIKELGLKFRYALWAGTTITVNGQHVRGIDRLYLQGNLPRGKANPCGQTLSYMVRAPKGDGRRHMARIEIQFVELPVSRWHSLSNREKNEMGIAKGAGVSIVRAGREIDYGWYFMGTKRRENYDDWWRCEVRFSPELDELFGVTHTKQMIRPTEALQAIITEDVSAAARALNQRVRKHFEDINAEAVRKSSVVSAIKAEKYLAPTPHRISTAKGLPLHESDVPGYRLSVDRLNDTILYTLAGQRNSVQVTVNADHPFYDQFLKCLRQDKSVPSRIVETLFELLLLAAARAEFGTSKKHRKTLEQFRRQWSDNLNAFMREAVICRQSPKTGLS